ncbi:MAG: GldG family protein, partial [Odoribacter sp.]|nr:GldG family protein [Odoribacter sp.]
MIYFLVVIVILLLFSIWRLQVVRGRQSGRGVFLRLVGIIAGVAVVSYCSSRPMLTWYWDMTATRSNTISTVTQDLLRQLDGELKITTYVNILDANYASGIPSASKKDFERFRPYARFKRNLKLDYVYYYDHTEDKYMDELYAGLSDKERAEKICKAGGLDMKMFLAPEEIRRKVDLSGELNRFVRRIEWNGKKGKKEAWLRVYKDMYVFPGESEVAAALKSLATSPVKLAFLTGHGERGIDNRKDESYTFFSNDVTFRNSLINQGFEVSQLSLAGRTEVPETVDILVIAGVREALHEDEYRMIAAYIDRGGNLMVLGEPGEQEWVNPIVNRLGVKFREGMLLQCRDGYHSSLVAAGIAPEG